MDDPEKREHLIAELEELRRENRTLRAIGDSLQGTAVHLYDREGTVIDVWGAGGGSKSEGTLVGERATDFLPGEVGLERVEKIRRVFDDGQPASHRSKLVRGHVESTYRTVLTPMRDEEGRVVAVVGLDTDVTAQVRAEEELRASQERLQRLERQSRELIVEFGPDGHATFASENHLDVLGYAASEILGRSLVEVRDLFEITNMSEVPDSSDVMAEMQARGSFEPLHRVRTKDGRRAWLESGVTTYLNEDGRMSVLAVSRDVTDRVEAEHALQESATSLRTAQRIARVGSWEWSVESGSIEWSEESYRIFGQDPDQGAPQIVALRDSIHPDDRDGAVAEISEGVRQGVLQDVEFRFLLPSGEARVFCVNGERVDDGSGRFLGTVFDITARRTAEQRLRASEQRLRAILSSLTKTALVVFDLDCRIRAIYGGGQEDYGLDAAQTRGTEAGRFLREDARPQAVDHVRSVLETGEAQEVREYAVLPRGEFVFDVSTSAVRNGSGEITAAISVCHDVTDRVRAEEAQADFEAQMQQSQKLESLGLLAGGIAHDFNNLLVGILGSAELAMTGLDAGSPTFKLLQDIEQASQHASDLTNQLLAYAGRGRLDIGAVDLTDTIRETRSLLEAGLQGAARLILEDDETRPWIRADAVQVRQIAMNLVTNASEALGPEGGDVILRTGVMQAEPDYLRECVLSDELAEGRYGYLEVQDAGSGMDEATLSQIFDPFYTTKFQGRGLGLSAVMGIVRGHDGTMHVETEPGRGATFRALFPLTDPGARGRAVATEALEDWKGEGTILIVDDSAAVRTVAASAVEGLGFSFLLASSGYEAIEILRSSKDEIVGVVLDLTMPGMDGAQTFRALRSLHGEIPVLFMSGYSEELIAQRMVGEAKVASLHKPFTIAALASGLRGLLDS